MNAEQDPDYPEDVRTAVADDDDRAHARDASAEPPLSAFMSERALSIRALSLDRWGCDRAIELVGFSPVLLAMQTKIDKIAGYRESVLVTGESGAGKELVAQALYLLGQSKGHAYVSVNCPQFQEGNLTVSELFGHRKGSFTGAIADRLGAFEEAHGGTIFLDEIADLHTSAQAMLLRALATGEFKPLGATRPRAVDVRVVAATNRPLNKLMLSGAFRHDLFFRLRHFHVDVPPLRARGDDWRLILDLCLLRLGRKYGVARRLSPAAERLLSVYTWPGNVRQLIAVVTTGYAMADGTSIEPEDFASQLEHYETHGDEAPASMMGGALMGLSAVSTRTTPAADDLFAEVVRLRLDFWSEVHQRFLSRDLNRTQVKNFVKQGLDAAGGNYRRLLELLHLPESDYQRFMDFLRHHDLKP